MKNLFLFLLGFGVASNALGQHNDLYILAASGSTYQANDLQLDWTLGEVIIHTVESPSAMITQGFHQPGYTLVSVNPVPAEKGQVRVWPNPFDNEFEITLSLETSQKGVVGLYDMSGKVLWTSAFEGKEWHEKVSATLLPSGQYVLTVTPADGVNIYSYQMIKTQ